MPTNNGDFVELTGWKEIASYLGVSVRTAQSLERDRKLPIRRKLGPKGGVFSDSATLDAWKSGRDFDGGIPDSDNTVMPIQVAAPIYVSPEPATLASGRETTSNRRAWVRYILAGSATGAAAIAAVMARSLLTRRSVPAAYLIQGGLLLILDGQGSRLWSHSFETAVSEEAYRGDQPKCFFCDLDGDGHVEVVFYYSPPLIDRKIICFSHDGVIRWEFIPGRPVTDILNRTFTPPYWPADIRILPPAGRYPRRLLVTSNHNWSFPMQVATLDGSTGRIIGEYWHRGHLLQSAVTEMSRVGKPKLILGGVNDAIEYRRATLVVFDLEHISGASCSPAGVPYFKDMLPGSEEITVFFPKTPLDEQEEFNQVEQLAASNGRITVVVSGGVGRVYGSVVYEFDERLELLSTVLSDGLRKRMLQLQQDHSIPREPFEQLIERLKRGVKIQFREG